MKLLVVDDSEAIRKMLLSHLHGAGYTEVDLARDGAEALTLARQTPYGCILLDWNMPNLLGIDALKQLRAEGNTVPVVMVTTESEKRCILEAIKAGANEYVTKPFVKETLLAKVRKFVAPG